MPEISIIVPVYNTEKYIQKCLKSISSQSFTDFEVIIVNDGSPDNSVSIINEFVAADSRFKLFTKENEGVTKARKYGLSKASGKYIVWIDSDDWVEENHLQLFYENVTANNADVCVTSFIKEEHSGLHKFYEIIEDFNDPNKSLIETGTCRGCLVTKIAKKELYDLHDIFPPEGINCCEDEIISANLYYYSKKTCYVEGFAYHVNDLNENSLTRGRANFAKNFADRINVVKYFELDSRFAKYNNQKRKYNIKYNMFINMYICEPKLPESFYSLFKDSNDYALLKNYLKQETKNNKIRYYECYFLLKNNKILGTPFHFILAKLRQLKHKTN